MATLKSFIPLIVSSRWNTWCVNLGWKNGCVFVSMSRSLSTNRIFWWKKLLELTYFESSGVISTRGDTIEHLKFSDINIHFHSPADSRLPGYERWLWSMVRRWPPVANGVEGPVLNTNHVVYLWSRLLRVGLLRPYALFGDLSLIWAFGNRTLWWFLTNHYMYLPF